MSYDWKTHPFDVEKFNGSLQDDENGCIRSKKMRFVEHVNLSSFTLKKRPHS